MARLVPASRDLALERAWCCFRPGGFDRHLVVDRVPGLDNAWVSARHFRTGLLVAPAAARALADWIATGKRPFEVESFGLVGNG
jgi:glycine oxidase